MTMRFAAVFAVVVALAATGCAASADGIDTDDAERVEVGAGLRDAVEPATERATFGSTTGEGTRGNNYDGGVTHGPIITIKPKG